uniref:SET domain-containing protein n=1 Tax=Grammatophora oceanica TaxID=210454 RepID=A0A7S1USK8_9STRA
MFELNVNGYKVDGGDPVGKQLLLNYCFGHGKSTMVVCTASSSNLINHCGPKVKGEGQCDNRGPNAVVRWATDFDPETSLWLDMSLDEIDELVEKGRRGLSLEIVALRDIRADEEIFIDYGPEWEEAWERHLSAWSPPSGNGDNYVSINEMNKDVEKYVRTVDDLETDPYPIDVRVGCFVQGFHHPCQILEETPVTEADIPHDSSALNEPRRSVYRVRLEKLEALSRWEIQYRWHFPTKSYETPLSTKYIRFFPGVYSSDQHLPGAFRQQIGVPDDVWPKQWKNL